MSRVTSLLTLALAVQLLICAAVFWPRQDAGESDARQPLLALDANKVDRLVISDGENSLLLARAERGWIMPDYHGLPVQQSRVDRVVIDLPSLPRGWPVAESESADERFEVAENDYQRKLTYRASDADAGEIYIGTSPGFRKVHVRPAGADAVYAVEFNSFEVPATPEEWLDKTLLQVDEVTAVSGVDYSIRREDGGWQGDAGIPPAQEEVEELVSALTGLRVNAAADIATAAIFEDMDAPPTLVVETDDGRLDYRLFEIEDAHYIRRSDIPVYFSVSDYDYDRLDEVSADSLYAADDDGEESEADDNEGDTD